MGRQKKSSLKRRIISILTAILMVLIFFSTCWVLMFDYTPAQNTLGALASVCMDTICIIILLVFVASLVYDNKELNHTTKLFLGLLLGSTLAVYFDFLTWTSDGALAYGEWTYVYTVSSLCCGAILGLMFVVYLDSYMEEMYGLKSLRIGTRVCVLLNVAAFLLTITLAFTNKAFVFVDGHYETGALYDLITVLPILTLLFMCAYAISKVKTIGIHDVVAVIGYIIIMITGALLEAVYGFGTTYVSVTVADIFIFIMLQNKILDKVRKQRKDLSARITSQFEILESMAGIYSYVNYVDLDKRTSRRFDEKDSVSEKIDYSKDPHTSLNLGLVDGVRDDLKELFLAYTDLSTLSKRMANEKIISAEFYHKEDGWFRAQYIRMGDPNDSSAHKVIYAVRNIDEEKKNIEKWIKKSNTDELTGFYNRHAYEEDISTLEKEGLKENFVYISVDVNGLKIANDNRGHEAGDEMLVGACECMKQCFGPYGKLYRTGGDEFVALIYADEAQLKDVINDLHEVTEKWRGKQIEHLAISCGYVAKKEAGDISLHQIAVLADKRMYEDKSRYYQKKGVDRRGQRDAHVALCALYTKILKINVTDDTYQIVNMDADEKVPEKGFSDKISQWLTNFGMSGQVHPDDLEEYLRMTDLEYIRTFFKENKKSHTVFYRRKYGAGFRRVMMEMIPANDYTDGAQNLFLYVKDIE